MDTRIVIDATSAALGREVEEMARRLAEERVRHMRKVAEIEERYERECARREEDAYAAGFAEGAALADKRSRNGH